MSYPAWVEGLGKYDYCYINVLLTEMSKTDTLLMVVQMQVSVTSFYDFIQRSISMDELIRVQEEID